VPTLLDSDALRPPLPGIYDEARSAFGGAFRGAIRRVSDRQHINHVAGLGELFYAGRLLEFLDAIAGAFRATHRTGVQHVNRTSEPARQQAQDDPVKTPTSAAFPSTSLDAIRFSRSTESA
jgi:hypothetical protein